MASVRVGQPFFGGEFIFIAEFVYLHIGYVKRL